MVAIAVKNDPRFGWVRFYMEFADRLLEHKSDRRELVTVVRSVCNAHGYHYLDNSGTAQVSGLLTDICPLTVMGTFNRGISVYNRQTIARAIGDFLGVNEPVPDSFHGIPTLPAINSVVFWEASDINSIWQLFEDGIRFADFRDEQRHASFLESYNQVLQAKWVGRKATMGLFWIRPDSFLSLDAKSSQYIASALGIRLPSSKPPEGNEYLQLRDFLERHFQDPGFPVHSFPELSAVADGDAFPPPPPPPCQSKEKYTIDSILADGCFLDLPKLETMLNRLQTKQNIILQGPPGTGKTWLAKRLAYALIGYKDDSKIRPFQFHPNLSYEDFVRGWRPQGDGSLTLVDGPFLQMADDARQDPDGTYVIVIEEINRGNPASIFGEMLTLLEADKRKSEEALALAYPRETGERFHIPLNVYVIGTMNVADRSLALVDLALRRRFAFFDLEPVFSSVWRDWVSEQSGIAAEFLDGVAQRMNALNDQIEADRNLGRQFRIGHSYFTPAPGVTIGDPAGWYRGAVESEIAPLLQEYWFDNPNTASDAVSQLLGGL